MWELNHKVEHQRTDAFELWCWRRLDSPLDCREINLEYSLEELMQKLQYFGHLMQRTDIGKDPDAGQDWRQEEKGTTEDEMVGWHHQLSGHEFEQAPGKWWKTGSLAYCSPWGRRESDTTEWLNNNNYKLGYRHIESFYGGFIFDVILIIWRHFSYILRHITYLFDSWPPLFWSQILKSNKILLLENTFWETKIAKYLYFFSLNLFTKLITVC